MKWLAGMRITADRLQQGDPTDIVTYIPTVNGGGTATWATQIGYYSITDMWVDVTIYLIAGAAGSGTSLVLPSMPTNVDRTTRQALVIHAESVGAGGTAPAATTSAVRGGEVVFFTTGSGAFPDRIRVDESVTGGNEQNLQGQNILFGANTSMLAITGRYRRV